MQEDFKSGVFKKWLDTLQQESWQLELIISGFALYALFSSFQPMEVEIKRSIVFEDSLRVYFLTFTLVSLFVLTLNLTAHVILRGLWIGAIGLRYVSGEIDYHELNYVDKARIYLEKKVGPYDKFIADLEKYCSLFFAIAFLMVFYLLALFIIFAILISSSFLIMSVDNTILRNVVQVILILLLGVGVILTLIDFITLGGMKRNKHLFRIYYPYYRVFSVLTLSFIYRPIVYNLLDNRFGRRVSMLLIPIYVVILMIASFRTVTSNFIPGDFEDNLLRLERYESVGSPVNYEDELGEDKFAQFLSIPSKVITAKHLRVFIPFSERIEEAIYSAFPDMIPENDRRGIQTSIIKLESRSVDERREQTTKYLSRFAEIYLLRIDSLDFTESSFIISQNRKSQSGFETVLPLSNLPEGRHLLQLVRRTEDNNRIIARIPFWLYTE